MRIGHWQFSPSVWPTIAVTILLPSLLSLGFWQLDRAGQKRIIHGQFLSRQSAPAMDLNFEKETRADKNAMLWRNVRARGTFDGHITILLDNQVMNGEAGYYVFTPFRLEGENVRVLVNRGWLPAGSDRNNPPPVAIPDGIVEIVATAKDVPVIGIQLGNRSPEILTGEIIRVPHIELDQIAVPPGQELLPYVLRLRPESDHGYLREWHEPGSGEERHLAYAFQWFALAATLLVIYLVVNLKKIA